MRRGEFIISVAADLLNNHPRISKNDAIKSGSSYYWTGKECKNGHIHFRRVKNNTCVLCARSYKYSEERDSLESLREKKKRAEEILAQLEDERDPFDY